jgi:NADH-quinone oxidoreductase subunit A
MLLKNYLMLLFFFIFSIFLALVAFSVSFFLTTKEDDTQKLSAYECGFNPFEDSRSEFDVRFYLVAILFIIFDLEISFLFPFSSFIGNSSFIGIFFMFSFLFILTIGFLYE